MLICDFYVSYDEWAETKYYPYEGYDFLLGRDGCLYFLEANAVPAGIYVLSVITRMQYNDLPPYEKHLANDLVKFVDRFAEMVLIYYYYERGESPQTAIVTVPPHREGFLNPERIAISYALRRKGIRSWVVGKSKLIYENGFVYFLDPKNHEEIYPDLIIRRSFDFPKKVKQIVINPSEVGYITGSKIRTYKVISKLLDSLPELAKYVKIPFTLYSRSLNKVTRYVEEILEMGKRVVVKPASGSGGEGIIVINSKEELESKKGLLEKSARNKKYLMVQELILPAPILIKGNRYYAFDIRAYGFMGRLVGLHLRRAPIPIDTNSLDLDYYNVVSNVSAGGVPIIALMDRRSKKDLRFIRTKKYTLRMADKVFRTDDYVTIVGGELLRRIEYIVRVFSKAISSATSL
ncbi:MAG: ATP-grasp domain-containing protein [Candidatus Njordarchaeales archaeon]